MHLSINGQKREFSAPLSVEQLLLLLHLDRDQVVVELNREILTIDRYVNIQLKDDDRLELIQFVGGG